MKVVKFNPAASDFEKEIKAKVSEYFTENNLSRKGNGALIFKTFLMLMLFFGPFVVINIVGYSNPFLFYGLWVLMGFGMIGLGTTTMHDSVHGSYSKNSKVNKFVGFVMCVLGGSIVNWRIQHNFLHHTYTNIDGLDDDINSGPVLRLCPHKEKNAVHKFQHFYVWFLYGFTTFFWVTIKNYTQLSRYYKAGLLKTQGVTLGGQIVKLALQQIGYYLVFFGIPLFFFNIPFLPLLLGFFIMHYIGGFTLALIFQTAHIFKEADYPLPDENQKCESNRLVHQVITTANFATKSKFITWFSGGLNFQIEHHLFPYVSHIHYPAIAKITEPIAKKYDVPYKNYSTMASAVQGHYRMLRDLGRA